MLQRHEESSSEETIPCYGIPAIAPFYPSQADFEGLLSQGLIGSGQSHLLLGFGSNGEPWYLPCQGLGNLFICAEEEGGKSALVTNYVAQAAFAGARTLVIDPCAVGENSLSARMQPLDFTLQRPVATTAAAARLVLEALRSELEQRLAGQGSTHPLIFIVEELTILFEDGRAREAEWHEVLADCLTLLRKIILQGRKRNVFSIVTTRPPSGEDRWEIRRVQEDRTTVLGKMSRKQAALLTDAPGVAGTCEQIDPAQGQYLIRRPFEDFTTSITVPYARPENLKNIRVLLFPLYVEWYADVAVRFATEQQAGPGQPFAPSIPESGATLILHGGGAAQGIAPYTLTAIIGDRKIQPYVEAALRRAQGEIDAAIASGEKTP